MKRNSILILALTLLFAIPMMAENGMNSPYTRFGFGQLAGMETGTSKGMGGTGIGVHNSNQINMLNPASYAAIDTLTFLLDVGMSLQNANFSENGVKMNAGAVVNTDLSQFQTGTCVVHRKFGPGIIASVEPEGDDLKLEILIYIIRFIIYFWIFII